jgi:hypothetical protein
MTPPTNRPGRPSIDPHDQPVSVHVTMDGLLYDKAYQAARRERVNVPEWIRRQLRQATANAADR